MNGHRLLVVLVLVFAWLVVMLHSEIANVGVTVNAAVVVVLS